MKAEQETNSIIQKYFGSKTEFESFLKEVQLLADNRDRRKIGKKYLPSLQALLSDMESHSNPFLFPKGLIREIKKSLPIFNFEPFARKEKLSTRGRPNIDPEGYFIWEASESVLYKKGSYSGSTDWKTLFKIISHYQVKFPFLKRITLKEKSLKDLRNRFKKQNKPIPRKWTALERREKAQRWLKKNRGFKIS